MKKILSFLAVAALVVSCSKTDEAPIASTYTLTGHIATTTRVEFDSSMDFGSFKSMSLRWSAGDQIWVGSQQSEPLTAGGTSQATFTLPSAPQADEVVYNMMATQASKASTAVVPAEQDASKSLGVNGAFGRANLYDDDSFVLEYQTNFLWFNVKALPSGATLKSISLNAGDAIVAGSAAWEGYDTWGKVSNASSIIDLKVNKSSVSADEYIAMVILPPANMTIPSATITYELEISGATKYYEQTLGAKTFSTGEIARVSVDLSDVDLYELRTLTFEGDYWSALISESEYGNGNGQYSWHDADNTELMFYPNPNAAFPGYGGHAISNYTGSDLSQGDYMHDLQAYNVTGGANSSDNFCVHFGYVDESDYGMQNEMVGIEFDDNVARTIESMYVTNTTYVYNLLENGDGWQVPTGAGPDTTFKIVAYGYDSVDAADGDYSSSVEFTLWANGEGVSEWTKWDLSGLGKVVKVRFNLVGSDDLYGDYGLGVAGYFAYDDVVVRF